MGKNVKSFNENWTDDDNKKIIGKVDRNCVACGSEDWEKDPIINKMKKIDASLTKKQLEQAFKQCCDEIDAPHIREEFESCMIIKLI